MAAGNDLDRAELERVRAWQAELIANLGYDLREVAKLCAGHKEGMLSLLRLAHYMHGMSVVQVGLKLYWQQLAGQTAEQQTKVVTEEEGETPCQSI